MAKILGVFTDMHGKLGNAVLQTWKGIQVIRTHVIPANPQSTDQTTNRTLFTNLVNMFKSVVVSLVHKFWNPFVTAKQTGWANLIGWNQGLQQGTAIDYELVELSHGSLPGEDIATATYDTATGACVVTWDDTGAEGSAPGDFAMLCAYDKTNNRWAFSDGAGLRSEETETCDLRTGLTITDVYLYLFFFTGNFSGAQIESVSDSEAQESVAPA